MTFTLSVETVSALVAIFGGSFVLWLRIRNESKKMGVLEFKVDVMWQAQLRRAQAEAVTMGHGKIESPFTAHPEAADMFGPLLVEMKEYLDKTIKKPLRDAEIIMLLEHEFGARVTKQVCIPIGFSQLGCMIIALSLIRGGPVSIETETPAPSPKIVKALADAPILDAAMVVQRIAGETSGSISTAAVKEKLSELVDENKRQTTILERTSEEVHDIHEDSAIRKRSEEKQG